MPENFRDFTVGPDPFGRTWQVYFRWLQTGISIRHADTVDVKFFVSTEGVPPEERVIALPHPALLALSQDLGHPLTDTWCLKLAALHLKHMLETGEDMEKTLVTVQPAELHAYAHEIEGALAHQ
ncbi:MAG TPA: hypothetical protein VME17_20275 [Bryobacteraceae bacterium]|nr:hypothetical protein [Bryobacteraceae bacterium]